jgi:hypothetical protein
MFRLRIVDALTEQIAMDAVELSRPVFVARSTSDGCVYRPYTAIRIGKASTITKRYVKQPSRPCDRFCAATGRMHLYHLINALSVAIPATRGSISAVPIRINLPLEFWK